MAQDFQFVIDKTPRYWEILDEIIVLFPKSKIIILKRNPLDVVKSIITAWNITSLLKLNYYRRDLLIAPKRLHEFCEKQKGNVNVYCLKYEDLIANTSKEVGNLYTWIGLNYREEVLDISKNEKHKGKYGDPYQNLEVSYTQLKKTTEKKELTYQFKSFIKGYSNFLGSEFLTQYGNYKIESNTSTNTKEFSYFIHLGSERGKKFNIKKEIKYFLKEIYFKIFLRA
jgi:hypothetical protein